MSALEFFFGRRLASNEQKGQKIGVFAGLIAVIIPEIVKKTGGTRSCTANAPPGFGRRCERGRISA